MFRGFIALVASMFLLAVVSVAIADEVKGKITKIDDKNVTVTDKDAKATVLVTNADTKIKLGKKDGTLSDLKVDQAVTATFKVDGGKNVASEIKAGKGK